MRAIVLRDAVTINQHLLFNDGVLEELGAKNGVFSSAVSISICCSGFGRLVGRNDRGRREHADCEILPAQISIPRRKTTGDSPQCASR